MSEQSTDSTCAAGSRPVDAPGTADGEPGGTESGANPALLGTGSVPLRRVLDVLLVVALVLVVVPFAVYAVPSLVGAEDSYVVRSGSMAPAIEAGDVVVVERATPETIETGDVITFLPDDQPPPTTHRVVSKTERDGVIYFETKGDANAQPDAEPVVENELVGRVTLVIPYVGYVIQFASTSMGFFALVAAPFGLLLATEVWSLFRDEGGDGAASTTAASRDDASGSDTHPASEPDGSATPTDDPEDVFTLTPTDVRLSLAALLVFTGYSSVVAVARPTPWSIAVAVGAFGTTVYLGAMRYTATTAGRRTAGRDPPGPPPTREITPAAGWSDGTTAAADADPRSNGRLPASLVEPPTAGIRPGDRGNGHRQPSDRNDTEASGTPASGSEHLTVARTPLMESDPADEGPTDGDLVDEETDGDLVDGDVADEEPTDDATTAASDGDDGHGLVDILAWPFLLAGWACYRFLYLVGYVEVTTVRRLRALVRPSPSTDGGEP